LVSLIASDSQMSFQTLSQLDYLAPSVMHRYKFSALEELISITSEASQHTVTAQFQNLND